MKIIKGKGKLFLYAIAGLGVNMLNLIVGSYLCDALMVEGFQVQVESWTYLNKTLVVAGIWSIMIAVAKILDGFIDIPLAGWTDKLRSRWGKRRPAILIGFVPMLIAYGLFLIVPQNAEHSLLNTIYFGVMLCMFYATYTLTMVTYYATFSEIVDNDRDRIRLSNYKTIFDVVYFVLGYALIPMFIGNMNIRTIALMFMPLALTMLIPLFMIKEKSTLAKDVEKQQKENPDQPKEKHIGVLKSFAYAMKNKSFIIWLAIYFVLQFAVQMFLTGQNVLYSGLVQLSGMQIMIVMASAFAPVPFTLILYNFIIKKHGIKWGYVFSVIAYMLAMAVLALPSIVAIPDVTTRVIIACFGGVLSSFGTGCFFSINYTIPATLADIEKKKTGVSHPAMYFAVQGLFSGVATAISTGLVWVNLKGSFLWLVPWIIIAGCVVSVVMTIFLPKEVNDIGKNKKEN